MFKHLLPIDGNNLSVKSTYPVIGKVVDWQRPAYSGFLSEYLKVANGSWNLPYEWHTFLDIAGSTHTWEGKKTVFKVDTTEASATAAKRQVAVMLKLKAGVHYTLGTTGAYDSYDMAMPTYDRNVNTENHFSSISDSNDFFRDHDQDNGSTVDGIYCGETRTITPATDLILVVGVCTYYGYEAELLLVCTPAPEKMTVQELRNYVYIEE